MGHMPNNLLDIHTIYYETAVLGYPRGQEILSTYPNVERIAVTSHWNIPELHGNEGLVEDWNKVKRNVLVLGVKKTVKCTPFYRSCDFIAPSHANGCAMACVYCFVARRKGFANPITTFVNIEQIRVAIEKHANKQGFKWEPSQADPSLWVYEIGTNNDCSVDATISNNVKDLVSLFRGLPNAKMTFATKYVNREMLTYDPQGKARIRFSLMPQSIARVVDVRTAPIAERISAMNDFFDAGYEVNINFGPVIYYDGWLEDYKQLFEQIDDTLAPEVKAQLQAEVIFLTHNEQLHEVNLQWHPKAEELLWRPDLQEPKVSQAGGDNLRYKLSIKRGLVDSFCALLRKELPYCEIRYAF
jgi:spore photoproduct lyase family protein